MAKLSFDKMLSRSANVATFWPLVPGGIVAVVAGYLSRGVAWINAYGPFGWLMAALVAFFVVTLTILVAAMAFERFAAAYARRKWARDVDQVNPLDPEFTRKRLKLSDLVHPINGQITHKRFVDCQLLGPANIITRNSFISHTGFMNCDLVIRPDPVVIYNAVLVDHVTIIGGEIINCTIYVTQEAYDETFSQMQGGANLVSYQRPWQPGEADGEQSA